MSFTETYRHEVLQSRKIRSQRAFFWARIVGLILMITVAATLRADPQLRSVLMGAGMNGVRHIAGLMGNTPAQTALPAASPNGAPQNSALPRARIKINRPTSTNSAPNGQLDVNALAGEVARTIATQKVSP